MAPQLQRKKRRVARTTVRLDHCGSRRQVLWGEDLEGKNAEEFTKRRVGEDVDQALWHAHLGPHIVMRPRKGFPNMSQNGQAAGP